MNGYEDLLANVIPHLQAWWGHLITLIYLVGFGCFAFAMQRLAAIGRGEVTKPVSGAMMGLVAGVVLLNIPQFLDSLAYTVFNRGSAQALSYAPPAHEGSIYVQFAVHMVALIGLIGIARGVLLLKQSAQENGQLSRGLTHIFGGILCVNLPDFLRVLGSTIGGEVESTVIALIG